MARRPIALSLLLLWGCGGEAPGPTATGVEGAPIIDGELVEEGWPAVGALVTWLPDRNPSGSFCSASLIAPRWVLTAGHCLDGTENRVPSSVPPDEANYVHFFMGARADQPENGRLVRAARLFIHENYETPGGDRPYDIALIELAEEVTDVTPLPIHRAKLEGQEGAPLFYVGFGQSNIDGGGSGRKRSATLTLNSVNDVVYVTRQAGGGVCFGDSGGPGMLEVDGVWEVIGVNSTVFGGSPPCAEYSTQIRVDAYQTWIDAIMGQGGSCLDDPSLCACPEACNANGVCESAECGRPTCADILTCLRFCTTQVCSLNCFLGAVPSANYMYEAYATCITEQCPNQTSSCVEERCRWELNGCRQGLDAVTGEASCAETYRCREVCAPEDLECVDACEFEATLEQHWRLEGLDACDEALCGEIAEPEARAQCVAERCRNSILACLPDEACALPGGSCADGQACTPEPWVATYCLPSMGLELGAPCDPSLTAVCADGAHCVDDGTGPRCREACVVGADCSDSFAPCQPFAQARLPYSVGVCSLDCPDADGDGACDAADCAPFDASVHPGATEVCDPYGIDENCDGVRNEGCDPCQDPANAEACQPVYVEQPPLTPDSSCTCLAIGGVPPSLGWLLLPVLLLFGRRRGCAAAAGMVFLVACSGEDPGSLDGGRILVDGGLVDAGFLPAPDGAVAPAPGIFEIQQGLVAPGTQVTLEAIVVSPESGEGFYVSDGTARAYSGLWVQVNLPLAETPRVEVGDLVQVTGEVAEHAFDPEATETTQTRTEIVVARESDLSVVGEGMEVPAPVPLSMVELQLPEVAELYEGVLVRLGEASVTDRVLDEGELEVNDLMRVDDLFVTFDVSWVEQGSRFSVLQGPLHFDNGLFKVAPRDDADLMPAPVDVGECMPVRGYSFCLNRRSWTSAREDCGRQGGRLAILETLEENTLTSSLAIGFTNRSFWVGASDRITEGEWLWTDGSTIAYDPWHAGEPNDAGGGEDCAHHNWRNRQWNDARCGRRDPYFCEFRPGTEPVCTGDGDCAQGEGRCVDGSCLPPLPSE